MSACRWFAWIGQPFSSCDNCGQPAWEHDGTETAPLWPFAGWRPHRRWEPGEAEAIRRKWEAR